MSVDGLLEMLESSGVGSGVSFVGALAYADNILLLLLLVHAHAKYEKVTSMNLK